MAIMRRITEINGEIIMVETMIIVGNIILCTIHINGELVKYEIFICWTATGRSLGLSVAWSEAKQIQNSDEIDWIWRIVP